MKTHKYVESASLGIMVSEKVAKEIDDLVSSLPRDSAFGFKTKQILPKSSEFIEGERADIAWITTKTTDLQKEVVIPENIELGIYTQNPIVLFNHDHDQPIGRAAWVKQVDDGLKAKTIYADTPKANEVYQLVKQGILKGKSIGFLATEIREPTTEEKAFYGDVETIIQKAVLLEYSCVSVPCNSLSLTESVSKKLPIVVPVPERIRPPELKAQRPKPKPYNIYQELAKALERIDPQEIARKTLK